MARCGCSRWESDVLRELASVSDHTQVPVVRLTIRTEEIYGAVFSPDLTCLLTGSEGPTTNASFGVTTDALVDRVVLANRKDDILPVGKQQVGGFTDECAAIARHRGWDIFLLRSQRLERVG